MSWFFRRVAYSDAVAENDKRGLFLLALSLTFTGLAQDKSPPEPDDLAGSIEQWMQENLDDDVLHALKEVDQDRVRKFFAELQRRLKGNSIYDLASLGESARQLVPLLQQFDETHPYAVWLQTHLDYFDTATELRREMAPPVQKPKTPSPAPPLKLQRAAWNKALEKRPLPPLAQTYLPRIKRIFEQEGVPPELAWVAEVESSFDPGARSPAGAAGLFQLMPMTARQMRLSAWPRDERLQPEKNAHAAAKYLRHLHDRFRDWPLALAAYNVGETRVETLLKSSKNRSFDAISSRLPAETQMYVPKVEATLRKREGRGLRDLSVPA